MSAGRLHINRINRNIEWCPICDGPRDARLDCGHSNCRQSLGAFAFALGTLFASVTCGVWHSWQTAGEHKRAWLCAADAVEQATVEGWLDCDACDERNSYCAPCTFDDGMVCWFCPDCMPEKETS